MKGFGDIPNSNKRKEKSNKKNLEENQIINLAISNHVEGNIAEALKYYKIAINQGFADEAVFANYGLILKDSGNLNDAEKYTLKAIELNPNFANAYSNLGGILRDLGKLNDAEIYTNKAIQLDPNSVLSRSNMASILKDLGKLNDAEISARKAIELDPNFEDAYYNLGSVLIDLGKLKDAEIFTLRAIELNPNFASAYSNLGGIYRIQRKLSEAITSYKKAVFLNPDYIEAHNDLGVTLTDQGKLDEAIDSFQRALWLKPEYADAFNNIGIAFKEQGKLDEAIDNFQRALWLKPEYAEAHYNMGIAFKDQDKLDEAIASYKKVLSLKPDNIQALINIGGIFAEKNNLLEAEIVTKKAIDLNPKLALGHFNLGCILRNNGKLQEAEKTFCKAMKLNPKVTRIYYSLSSLQYSSINKWRSNLFSENIFKNLKEKDKVDLYFARSNVLHKEKDYSGSANYLKLANDKKLKIYPSNSNHLIKKVEKLLIETEKDNEIPKKIPNAPQSIFIVGMPRSGSTLLESILSMNSEVDDLGEVSIFEEILKNKSHTSKGITLTEEYLNIANKKSDEWKITTNKNLYNFQFAGIISKQIYNSKIIHCFRNPLDNILSIYRAHFSKGNQYSSSLIDCAYFYLKEEEIMSEYKKRFRSAIYDFNYDSLVTNPEKEIKLLISWLGWKWSDSYLNQHLNKRTIATASNVQVRSPINSNSLDGWKKYKKMLKPAIDIICKDERYINKIIF